MEKLTENYWNDRYLNSETGWDIKQVSPPLKYFIDAVQDKNAAILIPGCGNAYEASYMAEKEFQNVTLLDISSWLVNQLQKKFEGSSVKVIHDDFFLHEDKYDIIFEQTFFCAIPPIMRKDYVRHAHSLLNENGKIKGVLFNENFGFEEHPPFKGSEVEYRKFFEPYFNILRMEPSTISIKPRMGNELIFELQKKDL